jgi:hypothetical protein
VDLLIQVELIFFFQKASLLHQKLIKKGVL